MEYPNVYMGGRDVDIKNVTCVKERTLWNLGRVQGHLGKASHKPGVGDVTLLEGAHVVGASDVHCSVARKWKHPTVLTTKLRVMYDPISTLVESLCNKIRLSRSGPDEKLE